MYGYNLRLGGGGLSLPPGAVFRTGPDGAVIIDLTVDDYLLVPEELRSTFFLDPLTRLSDAATLAAIKTNLYLNISELIGRSQKGFALYPDGTAVATLQKACRYFNVVYGTFYGADLDGNTLVDDQLDIGAYEFQL